MDLEFPPETVWTWTFSLILVSMFLSVGHWGWEVTKVWLWPSLWNGNKRCRRGRVGLQLIMKRWNYFVVLFSDSNKLAITTEINWNEGRVAAWFPSFLIYTVNETYYFPTNQVLCGIGLRAQADLGVCHFPIHGLESHGHGGQILSLKARTVLNSLSLSLSACFICLFCFYRKLR